MGGTGPPRYTGESAAVYSSGGGGGGGAKCVFGRPCARARAPIRRHRLRSRRSADPLLPVYGNRPAVAVFGARQHLVAGWMRLTCVHPGPRRRVRWGSVGRRVYTCPRVANAHARTHARTRKRTQTNAPTQPFVKPLWRLYPSAAPSPP